MTAHKKIADGCRCDSAGVGTDGDGRLVVPPNGGPAGGQYGQGKRAPMDFDIELGTRMAGNLVPEIRTTMQIIAQEEVEVERLAGRSSRRNANKSKTGRWS